MGLVAVLFSVGLGLFAGGAYWKIQEDIINTHIQEYILPSVYYNLSDWTWSILPWVLIISGVICLIGAGYASHRGGGVMISE